MIVLFDYSSSTKNKEQINMVGETLDSNYVALVNKWDKLFKMAFPYVSVV